MGLDGGVWEEDPEGGALFMPLRQGCRPAPGRITAGAGLDPWPRSGLPGRTPPLERSSLSPSPGSLLYKAVTGHSSHSRMRAQVPARGGEHAHKPSGRQRSHVAPACSSACYSPVEPRDTCLLICLILATGAARHLPAPLPDTRQRSHAAPACSSACYSPVEPRDTCLLIYLILAS